MIPSVKTLSKFFPKDQAKRLRGLMDGTRDPYEHYECVRDWVGRCYNEPSDIEKILCALNEELGGFGVESIEGEYVDGFWRECVCQYINMGDSYDLTILYDTNRNRFVISSYGDWVESYERKGGKIS